MMTKTTAIAFVGALLHLSRAHHLPAAPAIAFLQDATPRLGPSAYATQRYALPQRHRAAHRHPQCPPLVHDDAERKRSAAAVKTWLLAPIEKKRAATAADIVETAPDEPLAANTSPPSVRPRSGESRIWPTRL